MNLEDQIYSGLGALIYTLTLLGLPALLIWIGLNVPIRRKK